MSLSKRTLYLRLYLFITFDAGHMSVQEPLHTQKEAHKINSPTLAVLRRDSQLTVLFSGLFLCWKLSREFK